MFLKTHFKLLSSIKRLFSLSLSLLKLNYTAKLLCTFSFQWKTKTYRSKSIINTHLGLLFSHKAHCQGGFVIICCSLSRTISEGLIVFSVVSVVNILSLCVVLRSWLRDCVTPAPPSEELESRLLTSCWVTCFTLCQRFGVSPEACSYTQCRSQEQSGVLSHESSDCVYMREWSVRFVLFWKSQLVVAAEEPRLSPLASFMSISQVWQ